MSHLRARFIGTGDAFGHGGRYQSCILLEPRGSKLLLDCGATSLLAMRQAELDPSDIDAVVISHFHGDHFGGIPYLVLDGQFGRRSRPLTIAGPAGIEERVRTTMETAFPGSSVTRQRFAITYVEVGREAVEIAGSHVSSVAVAHTPGSNAHGLRISADGSTLAYSGDTAWTDTLAELAAGSDVFICEAYSFARRIPFHLSYSDLTAHRSELRAARTYLTHLGPELLDRLDEVTDLVAEDGMVVEA